MVLGEPIINSTISLEDLLCPDRNVSFTCEIRGPSPTIQWISHQYIDAGGSALDFNGLVDRVGATRSQANSNSIATLITNTVENGTRILVSRLNITTSAEFPTASISCSGSGMTTITIQTLGNG